MRLKRVHVYAPLRPLFRPPVQEPGWQKDSQDKTKAEDGYNSDLTQV
jgi:hypothetical protein